MVNGQSGTETTRRRSREEVEADVRAALLRLLEEGIPFKDLTVDELARAAGLSRTAFYFYFPGKSQVLMAEVEEVAREAYDIADQWWSGDGPPEQLARRAVEGNVAVYMRHTAVLRSAVEATHYDKEVAAFYTEWMERFVAAAADYMRREQDAGRLREIDPEAVAPVLVWMGERCHHTLIGNQGRDPGAVVDALTTVWMHTLYPDRVLSAP